MLCAADNQQVRSYDPLFHPLPGQNNNCLQALKALSKMTDTFTPPPTMPNQFAVWIEIPRSPRNHARSSFKPKLLADS